MNVVVKNFNLLITGTAMAIYQDDIRIYCFVNVAEVMFLGVPMSNIVLNNFYSIECLFIVFAVWISV